MENLINIIKEKGYWKVIIRPVEFEEKRIKDKDIAAKIVEDSKIVLRGWDYPHIDHHEGIVRSGPDNVSSFCNWPERGHVEFWRFYLNGQFVHYFSMFEDYRMDEVEKSKARNSLPVSGDEKIDKFFSIVNALYSITEMLSFAANLARLGDFGEEAEVIVELGNVKGRVLFFWGQPCRHLFGAYACRYEPIEETRVYSTKNLIDDPANLALEFTIDIFKEFNWKDANKNVFLADQKKLIERRL